MRSLKGKNGHRLWSLPIRNLQGGKEFLDAQHVSTGHAAAAHRAYHYVTGSAFIRLGCDNCYLGSYTVRGWWNNGFDKARPMNHDMPSALPNQPQRDSNRFRNGFGHVDRPDFAKCWGMPNRFFRTSLMGSRNAHRQYQH